MNEAILLMQCPDKVGIIAHVSNFLASHSCNIVQSDQHSTDPTGGQFFLRVAFSFAPRHISLTQLQQRFAESVAGNDPDWPVRWKMVDSREKPAMGILVSRQDHCLYDLLYRHRAGDLAVKIPLVISNHEDARSICELFSIPFFHFPINEQQSKTAQEALISQKLHLCDFVVLARYMQVLSEEFLGICSVPVINIHHSFLPSFKGANPYRQAFERGVKIIGATAHYVTGDLDEGPIIAQEVTPISHRDNPQSLQQKGKDLEKRVLAHAIAAHIEHRVLRWGNKTIVFA